MKHETKAELYRIADLNMKISIDETKILEQFAPYKMSEATCIHIEAAATPEKRMRESVMEDGRTAPGWLQELNALYRMISEQMPEYNGMMIHASALSINGKGFLFSGRSGAGKSTHARMWRETFGDSVNMINDDKPLIRVMGETFWIYGTPVDGKHHLSSNTKAPLCGICFIRQGEENEIRKLSVSEALPKVMEQIYRNEDGTYMQKLLELVDRLLMYTPVYELTCTISHEAAELACQKMKKGK